MRVFDKVLLEISDAFHVCNFTPVGLMEEELHEKTLFATVEHHEGTNASPATDHELYERKLFATFERHGEFSSAQLVLLSVDLFEEPTEDGREEHEAFRKISAILNEYQEQSYLLDPFLEQLVVPVVERLKEFAKEATLHPNKPGSMWRVDRLAMLLYSYIKCLRFFPHEIVDLTIALDYTRTPGALFQDKHHWALRYGVLLWLSLICIIPFDLSQFDEPASIGRTASLIESLGKEHLGKAGLERDAAAMLLSRFYMRNDTGSGFHAFVEWSQGLLRTSDDIFTTIGLLQVVCDVVKSGLPEQIKTEESSLLSLATLINDRKSLSSNSLVRKYKTKLVARIGLRMLPGSINIGRRKGRTLAGEEIDTNTPSSADEEIPDEIELILEQLLQSLQDKVLSFIFATQFRWSSAKGIARIAERLPPDFARQVLETIIELFSIHSIAAASLYDLPAIAESTWHGACLACAEMARRSLVPSRHLPALIDWLSKALYFDLRKGAHSIGSNVRDAASYVLWALARTQEPAALIPHASNLAKRLAAVALFDREVHIRRAASAAFQEHVGRMNLFPHGIDVLAKADFYAVSVRKNAYLVAASQVAEHAEYRQFLFDHLLDVVLRHWDVAMRELGAQSLRSICLLDLTKLGPEATSKAARLLESADLIDLHGGILVLSEIAQAYRSNIKEADLREQLLRGIFKYLANIPESILTTPRNDLVTSAACRLLARSLTIAEIELKERSSVPNWRTIVDFGLKHRNSNVQKAAAEAMAEISRLTDCSSTSVGGHFLSSGYDYIYLKSDAVNVIVNALRAGLNDYTIDERGDVGSWVRVASIQGLTSISELMLTNATSIPDFERYFPPENYHAIISGILKQGVERLDNVRQEAGSCFIRLLRLPLPSVADQEKWSLSGLELLKELFESNGYEPLSWSDGAWLFPRAIRLLGVPEYRQDILSGILLSLSSKTDSTRRPIAKSLVDYIEELPVSSDSTNSFSLLDLVNGLIERIKPNLSSNTIVVPILQTFEVLLEADGLRRLSDKPQGVERMSAVLKAFSEYMGQ
ncbi:uncharacterized protein LACBIDRAFT_322818 [Laccaria bicolor S238N-H82]|uniref:Predicted protein n=1 Tax=Laccaria bicolor (strain S238N-H82 / ATCC MYA-4686) TaxID=486041 RepID=B0CV72_LACBS|nr:uncharacterized protein LACBIDRAFT_322818 [Laccaria bicolor S238N-H82]EDR13279.1 predicted protein [Laccaria bicolor S238N-H82]|eukprot:XP_001875777.1 predicted protein [Laccaria bicolor S238N-H82]